MDLYQYNETKNRQMQLMLKSAQEKLKKYTVDELCKKGSIQFDINTDEFLFLSMGQMIRIHYPDFKMNCELDMWHHLTILQYMDTADGSALSGNWIGLSQMRGGLSRGKGFDQDISTMIERDLKEMDAETVKKACLKLGGVEVKGKADLSVRIPYAPMFPGLFNYWEGDDEFLPSGKVLVDKYAEHYLTTEAAGGACSAVVQRIIRQLQDKG